MQERETQPPGAFGSHADRACSRVHLEADEGLDVASRLHVVADQADRVHLLLELRHCLVHPLLA
eukprot:7794698-Heterocapsa_arctica.AAC.1